MTSQQDRRQQTPPNVRARNPSLGDDKLTIRSSESARDAEMYTDAAVRAAIRLICLASIQLVRATGGDDSLGDAPAPPALVSHALVAHVSVLRGCLSGRTQTPGFFRGRLRDGAVVIDVGANDGSDFSLPGAEAGGLVLGFEPVPSTFARFHKRAIGKSRGSRRFEARKVDVEAAEAPLAAKAPALLMCRAAAGDARGSVEMAEQAAMNGLGSSLVSANVPRKDARVIRVPVVRLDEFVPWALRAQGASNATREIFVLKVDSQGYEIPVLRGASRLFREWRVEYVYSEFSPRMLDRWAAGAPGGEHAITAAGVGGGALALLEILRSHGFLCFDALEQNTHVPEDRPSEFRGFVRAHFEHRKGLKCGPGTACFGGENGVGKWGDLVCVNVARYGLEAAIDRLLCALHCSQACGVAGVRDKIVAYVRDEERKAREDYWASWSA